LRPERAFKFEAAGRAKQGRRPNNSVSVHPTADFSALVTLKHLVYLGVLIRFENTVSAAQKQALDVLASRGVDVVCSDNVDELVDLLSPVMS